MITLNIIESKVNATFSVDTDKIKRLFALEYFDGTFTSVYRRSDGKFEIFDWFDKNEFEEVWLKYVVTKTDLLNYLLGRVSFREMLLTAYSRQQDAIEETFVSLQNESLRHEQISPNCFFADNTEYGNYNYSRDMTIEAGCIDSWIRANYIDNLSMSYVQDKSCVITKASGLAGEESYKYALAC